MRCPVAEKVLALYQSEALLGENGILLAVCLLRCCCVFMLQVWVGNC